MYSVLFALAFFRISLIILIRKLNQKNIISVPLTFINFHLKASFHTNVIPYPNAFICQSI